MCFSGYYFSFLQIIVDKEVIICYDNFIILEKE